MATAVESPGIVSAKEEAAAILFARETQTPPVMSAHAPEQSVHTHEHPVPPTFIRYHEPETMPVRPKVVDTSALRPYENFDEVEVTAEPQVVRPYIDTTDYPAAVATTSVEVAAPVTTVVETPKTVVKAESELDTNLEEGTQYVVKFKKSTLVAASIVATIFLLMAVLFVVNIVNLVTMSAEVSALSQETTTLEQSLKQGQTELNQTRNSVAKGNYEIKYVEAESATAETANATTNSSFFDWLCHSLSRLFS